MKIRHFLMILIPILVGLLAACRGNESPPLVVTGVPTIISPTSLATPVEPAMTADPVGIEDQPGQTTQEPTLVPAVESIDVTYITPAQQEGPYYPVDKPADRDNDLVVLNGASGLPAGEILVFGGKVYDLDGQPVEGAVVEIWQTDTNGVYLHPNDPGTSRRDLNFQGYGESQTLIDGSYAFRTILPGLYEPRPRHIHVKVRLDGQELLTTQFYFAGEIDLQGDDAAMLIAAVPVRDSQGNPILVGERDIVLGVDLP